MTLTDANSPSQVTELVAEVAQSYVYVWGDNTRGQVLQPPRRKVQTPTCCCLPYRIDRVSHRTITCLHCGPQSTWLVSDGGDVYAGGLNNKGQISPSSDEPEIHSARHLEEFESMTVKSVAAGEEHTVLVLETGIVVSYGTNEFGQLGHGQGTETLGRVNPKRMLGLKVPVSQACCGAVHTLVLTSTGQVYACGNSGDGCLGFGQNAPGTLSTLQPIPALVGVPIQQIATGPEHSMALSLSGSIFSWGRNRKGRLGLGLGPDSPSIVYTPTLVRPKGAASIPYKYIATGPTHSAAIGPGGCVYLCGDNGDAQLGQRVEHVDHSDAFQRLEFSTKIRLVACGDRHTVIIDHVGEVYCFGRNVEGQLGQPSCQPNHISHPSLVNFSEDSSNAPPAAPRRTATPTHDLYFYAAAAGCDHTVVVAIAFPQGISRRDSLIVIDPLAATAVDGIAPFQAALYRLSSSKTVALHPRVPKVLSSSGGGGNSPTEFPFLFSQRSHSLQHLPSLVSKNPVRPTLFAFQGTSFESPFSTVQDATEQAKKARHLVQTPCPNEPQSDDTESHLPSGCSVGEILSMIESVRSAKDSQARLRCLKRRLGCVFSDPHRLNCSFLLPGRLTLLDVEGVEEIFDEIDKLETSDQDSIYQSVSDSSFELLSIIDAHAIHFIHPDQVRCIALVLQLRFLRHRSALNLRLTGRVASIVFKFPESGRRCLVDLFKTQYPANTFGQRLVSHVREFLNTTIQLQGGSPDAVWHGIVLLQLMFLSSIEWAAEERRRAIEMAGRAMIVGKIPLEDFVLESINELSDNDLAQELAAFKKYGPQMESEQLTVRPDVNLSEICRGLGPISASGGLLFTPETFANTFAPTQEQQPVIMTSRPATSQPQEGVQSSMRPEHPEGVRTIGSGFLQSLRSSHLGKRTKPHTDKPGVVNGTTLITGRRPGIFDPPEALTVKERQFRWTFFLAHQNICPLKFKRNVIMMEAVVNQQKSAMASMIHRGHPFFFMAVRRAHVVEYALNTVLRSSPEDILKPMKVIFDGEEGVDAGGLKREFFDIIVKTLFDPQYGMFIYNPDTRTVWFNRNTIDTDEEFFLVGTILGLALYNDNLLNLQFANVVWKKLQDLPTSIDDLVDLYPTEGESLLKLQDWPLDRKEFMEAFASMTFEVQYDFFGETRTAELKPGGKDLPLLYDNRKEYVDCYVDYLLNSSVFKQFEAFKLGFLHFQTALLKTLSADELRLLVCGTTTYDFNELREGAIYEGFHKDDTYIQGFWEILDQLDIHQKKKFLRFCTGTDRVPLGGLKESCLKVQRNGCEPTDRLPTAYTCFNLLLLPEYSSKEKLKRVLIVAIEQFQGFGLK